MRRSNWASGADSYAPMRSIAADVRDRLWIQLKDGTLDHSATGLDLATRWLSERINHTDEAPVDLDALAISALALKTCMPGWLDSADGSKICERLIDALATGDHLAPAEGWAAAITLRVIGSSSTYAADAEFIAARLTELATQRESLDTATLAQTAVALRSMGRLAPATTTRSLVGDALEVEDLFVIAQAFAAATESGDGDPADIERWRDFIAESIELRRQINRTNFVALCACLQSLATWTCAHGQDEEYSGLRTLITERTEAILDEGRRGDGSWYKSPWNTAWGLLTAHVVNTARSCSLSASEVAELVAALRAQLQDVERELLTTFRSLRLFVIPEIAGLLLAILLVVLFLVFAIPLNPTRQPEVTIPVLVALATVVGVLVKRLVTLYGRLRLP